MSGAVPPAGSYRPNFSPAEFFATPSDALHSIPRDPQITAISSERMSPNMFSVKNTSNWLGSRASCMAALSTYMCDRATSG